MVRAYHTPFFGNYRPGGRFPVNFANTTLFGNEKRFYLDRYYYFYKILHCNTSCISQGPLFTNTEEPVLSLDSCRIVHVLWGMSNAEFFSVF